MSFFSDLRALLGFEPEPTPSLSTMFEARARSFVELRPCLAVLRFAVAQPWQGGSVGAQASLALHRTQGADETLGLQESDVAVGGVAEDGSLCKADEDELLVLITANVVDECLEVLFFRTFMPAVAAALREFRQARLAPPAAVKEYNTTAPEPSRNERVLVLLCNLDAEGQDALCAYGLHEVEPACAGKQGTCRLFFAEKAQELHEVLHAMHSTTHVSIC